MKMRLILLFILILSSKLWSQCPVNWEDSAYSPEEVHSLVASYDVLLDDKQFLAAQDILIQLKQMIPQTDTVYYLENRYYLTLGQENPSEARNYRTIALDLLMEWQNHCHNHPRVSAVKAYSSFMLGVISTKASMGKPSGNIFKETDSLFQMAFELNGVTTPNYLLLSFAANTNYLKKYSEYLSNQDIIERFDRLHELIDLKMELYPASRNMLEEIRNKIDGFWPVGDPITCEFLNDRMGPRFNDSPSRELAKKLFRLMLDEDCTNSPLWNSVVEYLYGGHEPNFRLMYNLALNAFQDKDYVESGKFARMARDDASNEEEKRMALELLTRIDNAECN